MRVGVVQFLPLLLAASAQAWSTPLLLRGQSPSKLGRVGAAFLLPRARAASSTSTCTTMSIASVKEFIDTTNEGYEKVSRCA